MILNLNCTKVENVIVTPNSVPTPPVNFNAIPGNKKAFLSWNSPSSNGGLPLNEYLIYRGDSSNSLTIIKRVLPDSISFVDSDSNLVNGNDYYYAVSAKNDLGESEKTPTVRVIPTSNVLAPTPPQNFVGFLESGHIRLNWHDPLYNGGSSIINYKIYKGYSTNNIDLYAIIPATTNTYIDSGSNTCYYYISASNASFEGKESSIISIIVNPTLMLPLNNSLVSTVTPILKWESLVSFTSYHLQLSLDTSFSSKILDVPGLSLSEYTIPENLLHDETTYFWRVKALFQNDSSLWSPAFSFGVSLSPINTTNKVLIELFTNTSCIPCVEADNYLDGIHNLLGVTDNDSNVIIIRYHTTLFAGDPFYLYNVTDNNARMAYYPNSAIVNPRAFLLGIFMGNYSSAVWTNKINTELFDLRSFAIELTNNYNSITRFGNLEVTIRQVKGPIISDLVYHIVVSENEISYSAPNGQTQFNNTLRDLITPPDGQPFAISTGQTNRYDATYAIDSTIDQSKTDLIVFVQRVSTRDVLGVEKIKLAQ